MKSNCCKGEIKIEGGDEEIMFYRCMTCFNACDLYIEDEEDFIFSEKYKGKQKREWYMRGFKEGKESVLEKLKKIVEE